MLRKTLLSLVTVFILVQFIPVNRNNPPMEKDLNAPDRVKTILRVSCYDCHSHETKWPSYSRIAPISWLIAHHVREGREYLNFSHFESMDSTQKRLAAVQIKREIEKGSMPLAPYVWMHSQAKMTPEKRQIVLDWLAASFGAN
ncbi:MAG: heme-binding domain-containing protein [candidate division KSB1 bacterium]|nr:heme-binding domain-containing protein [candidate division KSB1 bacterium]MDZ7345946.1 heme-binding domain-containing protein [candidate division KSB1 bacterium]